VLWNPYVLFETPNASIMFDNFLCVVVESFDQRFQDFFDLDE